MKPTGSGLPDPRGRLALAAGALALAGVLQAGLLFGGSLHHFDWLIHWHYYDWIRIGLQEHGTLPLFMIDAWHTPNFVANAQSPVLGPLVWLLAWLPTELYVKGLVVLYTALGGAGAWLLARDLGARPALAACVTVLWTCNGFLTTHVAVGHHWSLGTYWLPWLLWLVRRARSGSRGALLGAAAVQALPLLEGQHHPFLWQTGLVGSWAVLEWLRERDSRAVVAWLGATLLGVALAGVRVVPVLLEFADYVPEDRIGGLPPAALLHALTARGQGPETAGFGVVFAHGSGWWEYAFYLGWLGLAFVAVGVAFAWRREASLLLTGAVALLLSLDTSALGFDLWEILKRVPVAATQRGPSRLLGLALFAGIFASAVGWERLLASRALALRRPRAASVALAALAGLLLLDLVSAARPWQRAALGTLQASRPHRVAPPVLLPPARGTVEEVPAGPNALHYRVRSEREGFLAAQLEWDLYGTGWSAEGKPTVRAPGGHLAVPVPAGESEVRLRYWTPGLAPGLVVSGVTVLGVLAGSWLERRRGPEGTVGRDSRGGL